MEDDVTEHLIDRFSTGLQLQPVEVEKPELPQEIIEAIVDEVAAQQEPEDTLKKCLQVARSFVYPAQKHLFKSIDLTAPPGQSGRRKAQKFWYHLLKSSPHIGVHVRELAIGGDTAFQCYLPEKCERSTWTTCTWMTCAAINAVILLPRILPLLSSLGSFTFSFGYKEPRSWLEIPEASRSALEQLFQARSLQTVKLSFISNLTSQAFIQLFNIPNLILSHVSVDEKVAEVEIYIQELSIGSDTTHQFYVPGKCERSSWTTCTWIMGATPNATILPPQIFPLLVNLCSLTLSFSENKPGSWLEIPEANQLTLERLFRTASLQTAKLSFITGFTSRTLARLLNIPNLILDNVTMAGQVADDHIPIMHFAAGWVKLQTLTLSTISPSTTRALARVLAASPSSTGSFSKLSIPVCPDAPGLSDALEELIKAAGNIREFDWPCYMTAPTMRLFPRLSGLMINMGQDSDFFREVLRLLGQISDHQTSPLYDGSNGGIKHLVLVCYSLHCNPMLPRHTSRWNALDKMLSRPGLASLREIAFAVFDYGHRTSAPFLEKNVLPMQRERGVIVSVTNYKWATELNHLNHVI